jgi:hypothetical protein
MLGVTKKGEFCQLTGDWWFFCGFHKWQLIRWARRGAVVIISSLALFAGLKVDFSAIISQYFPFSGQGGNSSI